MFSVTINHKTGKKVYPIYFLEENPEIKYVHWSDGEVGDMCITDDGMISEVITRTIYLKEDGRKSYYIRTPLGYKFWFVNKPIPKFNCRGRVSAYTHNGISVGESESKTMWYRNLVMAYAQSMNEHVAIEMVFGNDIGKNKKTKMRKIVRTERFKTMLREELAKLLSDHGVTEGSVVEQLQEAMVMATNKKDVGNLMRGIENFQDMLGMREKQIVKTTAQITAVETKDLLKEINGEVKALDAKIEVVENA